MEPKTPLKIAFIGAGQVNFGGGEGPWDHGIGDYVQLMIAATRLEKLHGENFLLSVVGVCDPFVDRAKKVCHLSSALDNLRNNR